MHRRSKAISVSSSTPIDALEGLFVAPPDPMRSQEEWLRFEHNDLGSMSRADLHRERALARLRLLLDPAPNGWFRAAP